MKKMESLQIAAKNLRHILRISPIHHVFRRLQQYGFDPRTFSALEVFGGTDSYKEIEQTPHRYDLVVVDNFQKARNHYEHFDLFPAIFGVLNDPAVIMLNIIPRVRSSDFERLRQRQVFYSTSFPANVSFDHMQHCYRSLAAQNGKTLKHFFVTRRWTFTLSQNAFYYATLILHSSSRTNE